jgi:L-ascorbate metabolism protein UlaG (beta-lactamase superfamily)
MALTPRGEDLLTFVGHASTVIDLDGVRLLTDPVLRPRVAHLKRQVVSADRLAARLPDAVLISHQHFDHLDLPTLRRLGRDTRLIVCPGSGPLLRKKGFRRVEELAVGDSAAVGPVSVTAVPAEHDGRRWPFGNRGEAVGFLVEGSRRVYFAGDTDVYDDMTLHLPDLDLALLPVWGWGHSLGPGHMDPEAAARATGLLRPRLAVPIHWGTLFPIGLARWGRHHLERPPIDFADRVEDYSPETEVRVLLPGESTGIGMSSG